VAQEPPGRPPRQSLKDELTHTTDDTAVAGHAPAHAAHGRWKTALRVAIPILVFTTALGVLWRELRGIALADVLRELGEISAPGLALAIALTALSYYTLTCYDTVGLRYIGRALPIRKTGLVSYVAYAISNNVGLAGMGGAPLRYRYFLGLGIHGGDVMRIVAFGYLTFWVGFLFLAGVLFSLEPLPVPEIVDLPWADTRPIGVLFIVALAAYLAWSSRRTRALRIGRWTLRAPGRRMAAVQIALGAADWLLAGGALYALLPAEADAGLVRFLVVYLFAQTAGLVSTVPGGLGVFETLMALFLSTESTAPAFLSALLLYRVIYYLVPLAIAVAALALIHVGEHRAKRRLRRAERR
jgi:uncharacterized membrane protein YbhN (UPF0104 family)